MEYTEIEEKSMDNTLNKEQSLVTAIIEGKIKTNLTSDRRHRNKNKQGVKNN